MRNTCLKSCYLEFECDYKRNTNHATTKIHEQIKINKLNNIVLKIEVKLFQQVR